MFFIKLFCDTQSINKVLVKEAYDDYINYVSQFNIKYPVCTDSINEITKQELLRDRSQLDKYKEICIYNLLGYCKNYPNEKISKNRFIHEYREFPYRLEQNIDNILLDL